MTDGADGAKRQKRSAGPSPDEIRPALWNDAIDASSYAGEGEKYQSAVLDQYMRTTTCTGPTATA
jgi:hypothetical protein